MSCARLIVAIILPPLAVIDKGCGPVVVVTMLTILGWIPGIIGAIVLASMEPKY
ncbi:MAG: YqaE/Pmp3 family membrane protein [Chloroflexota bacterium]